MSYDAEANVWKFEKDFDTRKVRAIPLGRFSLGDNSSVRLYFGPGGLMIYITMPKDSKNVLISTLDDEVEFAGLGKPPVK